MRGKDWLKRRVILICWQCFVSFFHSEVPTSLLSLFCEGLIKLIMAQLPPKEKNCFCLQFPWIKALLLQSGFLISSVTRESSLYDLISPPAVLWSAGACLSPASLELESCRAAPKNWLNNLFTLDGSWSSMRLSITDKRVLNVKDFFSFLFVFANHQIQDLCSFGN